jgi:hypothetical protein
VRVFISLCLALLGVLPHEVLAQDKPSAVEPGKTTAVDWQTQVKTSALGLKDEPMRPVKRHYFWSNERRHDLFFPALSARRGSGGYVGVGGDQNYTLAAAAEAKAMWLLDIDADLVRMHRLYVALLPIAETPAAFLELFGATDQLAAVRKRLLACYGPQEGAQILAVYQNYRFILGKHLRATAALTLKGQPTTWLSNATLYQHVRALAQKGLIVPRIGNVYGPRTLLGIGHAAKQSGLVISTVYFSNSEAWFQYNKDFRRNMSALPFDDHSVILRTLESKTLSHPSDDFWHFAVQRATDFMAKMAQSTYRSADRAMLDAKALNPPVAGLSYIGLVR